MAFGLFVDWIYGNTLEHRYYSNGSTVTQEDLDAMMSYCKLYTLAEYLGIEILQNIAMDLLIEHLGQGLDCGASCIKWVYQHAPDSPMQLYMVRYTAERILVYPDPDPDGRWDQQVLICPQFGLDVIKSISKLDLKERAAVLQIDNELFCTWHIHRTTEECSSEFD